MLWSKSLAGTGLNTRSFSLIVATSCYFMCILFILVISLYNLEILKENPSINYRTAGLQRANCYYCLWKRQLLTAHIIKYCRVILKGE